MRLRQDREQGPEEVHVINVTPFIDVMLALLTIFMMAAPRTTMDGRKYLLHVLLGTQINLRRCLLHGLATRLGGLLGKG